MELSHSVIDFTWRPKYVLVDQRLRQALLLADGRHGNETTDWEVSSLNPKNLVRSLDTSSSGWRIDGATVCGTRFYAIPQGLPVPPLRIFVYLPDQTAWPAALKSSLDAALSVPLRDGYAIARLGIARHICRALHEQVQNRPGFMDRYRSLPFGSRLVFKKVASDVKDMELSFESCYELEQRTLPVSQLRNNWPEVGVDAWPPEVDIMDLTLVRQMHDTVSLVTRPGVYGTDHFVFKSAITGLDHMYHELRFLLTCPPHPHIMPRPLAIVSKKVAFGGKRGVVGFLLQHFLSGSLRDILPARQRAGTLPYALKLKWCQQTAAALLHMREATGAFYSDLRPDNVLLDEQEDIVLCDFEQRGNWHEWSAPEVLYRQYAENIRTALPLFGASPTSEPLVSRLMSAYDRLRLSSRPVVSETPVKAANRAWFTLSPDARDRASIYSLGLFIYTVFEGLSNVRRNIANQWPLDPHVEFPTMASTPPDIRRLIQRCTVDAPEWSDTCRSQTYGRRLVQIGGYLFPEGSESLEQNTTTTVNQVLDTALAWWQNELKRAETYFEAGDTENSMDGLERPTLGEVVKALQAL